jgi:hypothetical protein
MSETGTTGQTAIAEAPSGAGPTPPTAIGTATPDRPSGRARSWAPDAIALIAVVVMAAAGTGLYFRSSAPLTLGLVGGLTLGLGCTRWWRAALAGLVGPVCGFLLASELSLIRYPVFFWLPQGVQAAGIAAIIGAVVCFAVSQSPRLKPLLAAFAVLAIVGTMWSSGLTLSTLPASNGGTPLERLAATPTLSNNSIDEDVFLTYVRSLRAGQSYYPTAVRIFQEMHATSGQAQLIGSPLSYRLPTLYWLLSRLPDSPGALVIAMLVACSAGVIAAFVLARLYVGLVPALAGTSIVASMLAGYSGPMLLDTEVWAGILGLVAVTLVVLASRHERHSLALHSCAALVALAATSVRELAVAFLLLGLVAALAGLADGRASRRRTWIPWALGLVACAGILAAHWGAARRAYAGVAPAVTNGARWFHPDGSGLVSAVSLVGSHMWLVTAAVWVLVVLGMVGSVVAPHDRISRVMLVGTALLGPLVLLALHPPGWATYGVPGYWGDLVMPTTLACVPLAFVALRDVRREREPG